MGAIKPFNEQNNPAILKKFILVPDCMRNSEYHIYLAPDSQVYRYAPLSDEAAAQRIPMVVAVYVPTGMGPYKNDDSGEPYWEYQYLGVRVC